MNQTAHHTLSGQFFQMGARFAQTHTAQDDFSDGKFSPDEMIEGDAARDHVAAGKTGSHVEVVFSFQRFDRFDLDQSHVASCAGIVRISSELAEVAVTFQAAASNGSHLIHRLHRGRACRRQRCSSGCDTPRNGRHPRPDTRRGSIHRSCADCSRMCRA